MAGRRYERSAPANVEAEMTMGRKSSARWGLLGGLSAMGMVGIVLLSGLGSAGVARPSGFPGAVWTPSGGRLFAGCGGSHSMTPTWSPTTGNGHWAARASAHTCPASMGGAAASSYGESYADVAIGVPTSLPGGHGGVNLSWSLVLLESTNATVGAPSSCPTTSGSYSYNYGYTWLNETYSSAYCYALGEDYLYGTAYVVDLTSGLYYYATNVWAGISALTGAENYSYSESYTYSNPSYWTYNGSYSYNYSSTFGPSTHFQGTMSPQFFINGTFSKTHSYVVYTYLYAYVYAYETGYNHATTSALLNLGTRGNHETLNPIISW